MRGYAGHGSGFRIPGAPEWGSGMRVNGGIRRIFLSLFTCLAAKEVFSDIFPMNQLSQHPRVPEAIREVLKDSGICVMSTMAGNRPYCSLMRYLCSRSCTEIYLVTHRNTTKYRNLKENPNVSLMVDTREKRDLASVQALSMDGRYAPFDDRLRHEAVRSRFIVYHPDFESFAMDPDAEVLRIAIQSFLLLNGLGKAQHIRISP